MPNAMKVQPGNIATIVDNARVIGFNLDHLADTYEYHHSDGDEIYLIVDGTVEENNVTFTIFIAADFFRVWRFSDTETPDLFTRIERADV